MKIGSHMSMAGGHHLAVNAAADSGRVRDRPALHQEQQPVEGQAADRRPHRRLPRGARRDTGVATRSRHNSYLINLASPDDALWNKSIDAMVVEVERAEALGHRRTSSRIPARTSAAARTAGLAPDRRGASTRSIAGRRASRSGSPWRRRPGRDRASGIVSSTWGGSSSGVAEPDRLGVCVDTCHIFAAGYSLGSPEQYNETIADALDRAVGARAGPGLAPQRQRPRAGQPGRSPRRHRPRASSASSRSGSSSTTRDSPAVPMVLETPKGIEDGEELDAHQPPDLRALVAEVEPRRVAGRRGPGR